MNKGEEAVYKELTSVSSSIDLKQYYEDFYEFYYEEKSGNLNIPHLIFYNDEAKQIYFRAISPTMDPVELSQALGFSMRQIVAAVGEESAYQEEYNDEVVMDALKRMLYTGVRIEIF